MTITSSDGKETISAATQLGWLTVETFGRLSRYTRARRSSLSRKNDATRRFNFSDRELSLTDQLLIALLTDVTHVRVNCILPPAA